MLASGRDTKYLVLPCDLPLIPETLLRSLVAPDDSAPALFRLPGAARPEPFPALVPADAHATLVEELRAGRHSVRSFLEGLSPRIVKAPADAAPCFRSLNTRAAVRDPRLGERLERTDEGGAV